MSDSLSQTLLNAQKELEKRRKIAGVSYRPPSPPHRELPDAGWFSPPQEDKPLNHEKRLSSTLPSPNKAKVRVSPSLAAWCLDKDHRSGGHNFDGTYRLYKILQMIDQDGRGWLSNPFVHQTLTKKESPYYIYGRRQLKNILRRGEGLFWDRVKSKEEVRIRLSSRTKVAGRLLGDRLRGQEVSFPLQHLLGHGRGRQAVVNAALYTAIHAGQIQCRGKSGPISRDRLRDVSGCSSYRQRHYERRMAIKVTNHIQILGQHSEYKLDRVRIHQGIPAYKHTDYLGKINRHKKGADYIARRLPNSYTTPDSFTVVHSRRQRTINRHLDGLCHMGSEGSDRDVYERLFHENAAAAVRSFNRSPLAAFYPLVKDTKVQLWRSIEV